ncbi:MAG TPA: hypothetical protein VFY71_07950, partial [Planctomycetota bacterium]|nr:hypothetical protein [Planctomycetota bacterium]
MLPVLHGVFLAYLLLALIWNIFASVPAQPGRRSWEWFGVLPLQLLLTGLLVADRLRPSAVPFIERPAVAALFPLAFALALAQNLHTVAQRGVRLIDAPILLANVGLLICTGLGAASLRGMALSPQASAVLYDHAMLQHLLGSPLAHLSTLSWHVPLLLRRGEARSLAGVVGGFVIAALAGFIAVMIAAMLGTARGVLQRFEAEPRVAALRPDLHVGVLAEHVQGQPGLLAVRCPASPRLLVTAGDASAAERPVIVDVAAADDWLFRLPEGDAGLDALMDEAVRVAPLAPDIVLPFPDPDGVGALLFGVRSPQAWRALYERAAQRVHAAAPGVRLGVRFSGHGPASHDLFLALAAEPSPIAVAGPRLMPGPPERGGPAAADETLAAWDTWRAEVPHPPEFWILAAGCSAPAYGEQAQARFVEGCLARADARPDVTGILIEGWTDAGHTLG